MEWIHKVKKEIKCDVDTLDLISQDERGYLPTGVLPLDYVTGASGFPIGRTVEIFGLESVGKSAIVAALLGAAQTFGGAVALADTEHAYTNDWARLFGISPESLLVLNPDHVQQVIDTFKYLCDFFGKSEAPTPRVLAWDSIAATPVLEETDDDLSDKSVGLHARALSKGLRQLTTKIETVNALLVCTNQQKEKVGIWGSGGVTKIGGHAFDFHSCLQLRLKKVSLISDPEKKDTVRGMKLAVTAIKNKIYRPYLTSTVNYYFNSGFDDTEFVVWFAKEHGILKDLGGGGWKQFGDLKFQGLPEPEVYSQIEEKVLEMYYGSYASEIKQLRAIRASSVVLQPKWEVESGVSTDKGNSSSTVLREEDPQEVEGS